MCLTRKQRRSSSLVGVCNGLIEDCVWQRNTRQFICKWVNLSYQQLVAYFQNLNQICYTVPVKSFPKKGFHSTTACSVFHLFRTQSQFHLHCSLCSSQCLLLSPVSHPIRIHPRVTPTTPTKNIVISYINIGWLRQYKRVLVCIMYQRSMCERWDAKTS